MLSRFLTAFRHVFHSPIFPTCHAPFCLYASPDSSSQAGVVKAGLVDACTAIEKRSFAKH